MVTYEGYFSPAGANVGSHNPRLRNQDQSKKEKYRHHIKIQASKVFRSPYAYLLYLSAPEFTMDLSGISQPKEIPFLFSLAASSTMKHAATMQ